MTLPERQKVILEQLANAILFLICDCSTSTQSTVKLERSGSERAYKGHWSGPPQVGLGNYHLAVD